MQVHSLYGVVAEEVGWVPAPGYVLRRARALAALDPLPRGSLLEVGCGAGALLHDLRRMGFACEAIETGEAARIVARYLNRDNPDIVLHDTWEQAWKARFDYVVALEVLEHIEDDVGALRSWAEWLKPSGTLVLSVPAHESRWDVDDEAVGHFRRYERRNLVALLRKTGFEVTHFECWGFPLANLIRPIRNYKYKQKLRHRRGVRPAESDPGERAAMSGESGVDRSFEARFYPLQASAAGELVMRGFFSLQAAFAGTDLGNGYMLVARKH